MANSSGNNPCHKCGRAAVEKVTESRHGTTKVFYLCAKHAVQESIQRGLDV